MVMLSVIYTGIPHDRVAGLGRLSAGANMAMKPFVKRVITIFATNASLLRVIANLQIQLSKISRNSVFDQKRHFFCPKISKKCVNCDKS